MQAGSTSREGAPVHEAMRVPPGTPESGFAPADRTPVAAKRSTITQQTRSHAGAGGGGAGDESFGSVAGWGHGSVMGWSHRGSPFPDSPMRVSHNVSPMPMQAASSCQVEQPRRELNRAERSLEPLLEEVISKLLIMFERLVGWMVRHLSMCRDPVHQAFVDWATAHELRSLRSSWDGRDGGAIVWLEETTTTWDRTQDRLEYFRTCLGARLTSFLATLIQASSAKGTPGTTLVNSRHAAPASESIGSNLEEIRSVRAARGLGSACSLLLGEPGHPWADIFDDTPIGIDRPAPSEIALRGMVHRLDEELASVAHFVSYDDVHASEPSSRPGKGEEGNSSEVKKPSLVRARSTTSTTDGASVTRAPGATSITFNQLVSELEQRSTEAKQQVRIPNSVSEPALPTRFRTLSEAPYTRTEILAVRSELPRLEPRWTDTALPPKAARLADELRALAPLPPPSFAASGGSPERCALPERKSAFPLARLPRPHDSRRKPTVAQRVEHPQRAAMTDASHGDGTVGDVTPRDRPALDDNLREPTHPRGATAGSSSAAPAKSDSPLSQAEVRNQIMQVPWLQDASARERHLLCCLATQQVVPKYAQIWIEGQHGDRLYLVARGCVRLSSSTVIRDLGPGETFGESTLVQPALRVGTATATVPSQLVCIKHESIMRMTDHRTSPINPVPTTGDRQDLLATLKAFMKRAGIWPKRPPPPPNTEARVVDQLRQSVILHSNLSDYACAMDDEMRRENAPRLERKRATLLPILSAARFTVAAKTDTERDGVASQKTADQSAASSSERLGDLYEAASSVPSHQRASASTDVLEFVRTAADQTAAVRKSSTRRPPRDTRPAHRRGLRGREDRLTEQKIAEAREHAFLIHEEIHRVVNDEGKSNTVTNRLLKRLWDADEPPPTVFSSTRDQGKKWWKPLSNKVREQVVEVLDRFEANGGTTFR